MLKITWKNWLVLCLTALGFLVVFGYQLYWVNFSNRHLQKGFEGKVEAILHEMAVQETNQRPSVFIKNAFDSLHMDLEFSYYKKKLIVSSNYDPNFDGKLYQGTFSNGTGFNIYFPDHEKLIFQSPWKYQLLSILSLVLIIVGFFFTVSLLFRQMSLVKFQRDFINNITHEFKTPISTIKVAEKALQDKGIVQNSQKSNYFLTQINQANSRLNLLVDQVLYLAEVENLKTIIKETINLNTLINEAVGILAPQIEQKNVTINRNLPDTLLPIFGNKFHLVNAFKNVMENSVKYGDHDLQVSIKAEQNNKETTLIFSDNSGGIHDIKTAIQPFSQTKMTNPGFGLGLAYVKQVCERHKGSLSIKNNGNGIDVKINLPNK